MVGMVDISINKLPATWNRNPILQTKRWYRSCRDGKFAAYRGLYTRNVLDHEGTLGVYQTCYTWSHCVADVVLDIDEEALSIMKDEKFWYVVRNRRIKWFYFTRSYVARDIITSISSLLSVNRCAYIIHASTCVYPIAVALPRKAFLS